MSWVDRLAEIIRAQNGGSNPSTNYPLPGTGPAAPPGMGGFTPPPALGNTGTNMPIAPPNPGYMGPATSQAYAMAGPRVGFAPSGTVPSAPPIGQLPNDQSPAPISGGGGDGPIIGGGGGGGGGSGGVINLPAGVPISINGNPIVGSGTPGSGSGGWLGGLFGDGGVGPSIDDAFANVGWNTGSGMPDLRGGLLSYLAGRVLGDAPPPSLGGIGNAPTFTGQPMAPSPQWGQNALAQQGAIGGIDTGLQGSLSGAVSPGWSVGGESSMGFGSNDFGGGNWSGFGSGLGGTGWYGGGSYVGNASGGIGDPWSTFGSGLGGGGGGGVKWWHPLPIKSV